MNKKYILIASVVSVFLLFGNSAAAEDIYKWVDEAGVVHFSSQADDPRAQKAKLPEIMRARMGEDRQNLATCDKHGGINCQAGADKDGSVICLDGFKDASARHRFSCSSARLRLAKVNFDKNKESLNVFVRNERGIVGEDVEVYYMQGGRKRKDFTGPKEVKAFGVAEFRLPIEEAVLESDPDYKTRVYVRCMNCS